MLVIDKASFPKCLNKMLLIVDIFFSNDNSLNLENLKISQIHKALLQEISASICEGYDIKNRRMIVNCLIQIFCT